jgi:hypothetical protein
MLPDELIAPAEPPPNPHRFADLDPEGCEGCRLAALADSPDPVNADERRVALYVSGQRLTPQMRRKRRALDEAVTAGVAALGIDRVVDLASMTWELSRHADHWRGARAELARLWPDRERWKLAGQLAESPIWNLA